MPPPIANENALLAIWARTPTQVKVWIGLCLAVFAVLLTLTLRD